MTSLSDHVGSSLRERCLLRPDEKLLVAVSGGVDSMVLLQLLHRLAPQFGWKLAIAHFNHQLRGNSSDLDEQLVRKTARSLKLPVMVGHGNVNALAKKSGLSLELAARKLRHEFLAKTARQGTFSAVALAHHADDQVELFFLRLFRGSGGEGLSGMKWRSPSPMDKRITLIRPLLDVPKDALAEFARESGITWREDATNNSPDLPRNRVRHELLPLLRQHYQPGLARTILRVMDIVGAESDLAAELAARWLQGRTGFQPVLRARQRGRADVEKGFQSISSFDQLPAAVQRRVILSQLQSLGLPVDFDAVEKLRATANTPVTAGLNVFVTRDENGTVTRLEKVPEPEFNSAELEMKLAGRRGKVSFSGVQIKWELAGAAGLKMPLRAKPGEEVYDAGRINPAVTLRHWRPGDRFQPLGMAAPVKLQDLFTNAKIPRERRRELLVATAGGEIFWVEGLRMAGRFKVTQNTEQCLVWRWRRE